MNIVKLGCHYTYDKYIEDVEKLTQKYKGLLKRINYGKSYDNRELVAILIGKGKCRMICTAGVHGREHINTIVLMKIIETYCELYTSNGKYFEKIHTILKEASVLFVPLVNPDGYVIANEGYNAINNDSLTNQLKINEIQYFNWKFNARGVDINRNFKSKLWKEKYLGDKYFSEKESFYLKELFKRYKSDIYIDFHSKGECIFYHRQCMDEEYNKSQYIIAQIIREVTGYTLVEPIDEINVGDSGGNTVHYYSESIGGNAITIETVNDFYEFPLNEKLQTCVFNQISKVVLVLLQYLLMYRENLEM